VRDVAGADRSFPGYLNSAMGVLAIGGFFVAVGGVTTLIANYRVASTAEIAGYALAVVIGVAAIAAAGGMNAGHAWGWLIGTIVSGLVIASGVAALISPSTGFGAVVWTLAGILLIAALLAPASRAMLRPPPPRPDPADAD